jgi:hypothetical protein
MYVGMFSKVRSSAYDVLKINFKLFEKSADYRALGKIMRFAKINLERIENSPSLDPINAGVGCFSVIDLLKSRSGSMDSTESDMERTRNSMGRERNSKSKNDFSGWS